MKHRIVEEKDDRIYKNYKQGKLVLQKKVFTIQLSLESITRLENFAKAVDSSSAFIAEKAIEQFLELQDWQIKEIQKAVNEADSPNAQFVEHDEVVNRMNSLE